MGRIIQMSLWLCRLNCCDSWKTFSSRVAPSSSRWIHTSAINERNICTSSTDNENKGVLIQNSCVRFFAGCADLNLVGLLCLVLQVQWRRQLSPANQWSAKFTCQVLETVLFTWNPNQVESSQVELYCHSATCGYIQWNETSCLTGPRCNLNTDIQQYSKKTLQTYTQLTYWQILTINILYLNVNLYID